MEIKARIAITGRPGVGKTTLIRQVLARTPLSFGGMITQEVRKCSGRVGFSVVDLATGEEGVLAHLHGGGGPLVGRYRVRLDDLERVGVAAIRRAVAEKELVVIDEVAPMELLSPAFVPAVEEALASGKALLISTHANADHPIAHRVRQELTLFRVRLSNRDLLVQEIARALGAA
jgi:nucleoside-triphosphatase